MTYSALQLSQMLYLKKEYASAAAYLEEVAGIATGYPQFHAQFHLLQANMYADRSDYAKAEDYYCKALDTQEHTEPGVMASIHLDYGKMLWKQGLYLKGHQLFFRNVLLQIHQFIQNRGSRGGPFRRQHQHSDEGPCRQTGLQFPVRILPCIPGRNRVPSFKIPYRGKKIKDFIRGFFLIN